jgi:LPXTG-site transpeptidase (sortase) family protein
LEKIRFLKNIQSRAKILASFCLIIIGLALILYKPTDQITSTSFSSEPIEFKGFTGQNVQDDALPKRIIIPRLNVDIEVQKSNIVGGYWEVPENSAGWGVGSGIPGQSGNQVIFAHARKGLFLPLRDIRVEDDMYVLTPHNWHAYRVSEIKEVTPDQTQVIQPTEDQILTLYTCSGFRDEKRLIVIAKPN